MAARSPLRPLTKTGAACLLGAALALSACAGGNQKQAAGGALGALAGGLGGAEIGSGSGRLWATGAGAILGGLIGAEAGASLDRADAAYARQQAAGPGIPQQPPSRALIDRPTAPRYAGGHQSAPAYNRTAPNYGATSACRQLDGGFKPAFACQGDNGQWFVLQ
ncbi:MAG: hypothetical protein RIB45_15955 [Marivibrio sp.]|uniref:hypothetical protein n=1 Tax=Marivibrio sp. TaxID=2039719 RepID=UPI0032EE3BBF